MASNSRKNHCPNGGWEVPWCLEHSLHDKLVWNFWSKHVHCYMQQFFIVSRTSLTIRLDCYNDSYNDSYQDWTLFYMLPNVTQNHSAMHHFNLCLRNDESAYVDGNGQLDQKFVTPMDSWIKETAAVQSYPTPNGINVFQTENIIVEMCALCDVKTWASTPTSYSLYVLPSSYTESWLVNLVKFN